MHDRTFCLCKEGGKEGCRGYNICGIKVRSNIRSFLQDGVAIVDSGNKNKPQRKAKVGCEKSFPLYYNTDSHTWSLLCLKSSSKTFILKNVLFVSRIR